MDLQSILGYSEGSPFANNPYIDINSGTIDMSNTPINLVGIDNLGNKKKMKAKNKTPYTFPGSRVREIPMASGGPSASKAAEMLRDGTAQGHKLTEKQKKYFRALAHGWRPGRQTGGIASGPERNVKPWTPLSNGSPYSPGQPQVTPLSVNVPIDAAYSSSTYQATQQAKAFMKNKGNPNWENAYTTSGNIPFIDSATGLPATPVQQKPLPLSAPNYVQASDIQQYGSHYWYIDPQTGNAVDIDPSVAKQKRFQTSTASSVAKFAKGGALDDLYSYLFEDDTYEDKDHPENDNTAPTDEQIDNYLQDQQGNDEDYNLAMSMVMGQGNPYMAQDASSGFGFPTTAPKTTRAATNVPAAKAAAKATYAGGDAARYALDFYQQKGLPKHVAAGIVGNLIQESGNFRPDVITDEITGDQGTSHGIAQWHVGKGHDRWTPFLQWAEATGRNPKDLNTQLEYVFHEAQQRGDLQKTMQAKTPEEAANIFAKNYERPAIVDKNRARNAKRLAAYQKGGTYNVPYEDLIELKKAGYKFKLL